MTKLFRLALALAAISCASATYAASTFEAPANSGQRFPGMMLVDPTTGQPVSPSTGGGGGGAVYGPDNAGVAPTKPPVLMGLLDASGNVRAVSPTYALPTADALADAGIGTPADTAATVGGNGSTIAQLKQAVTQLSSIVAKLTNGTQGTINIGGSLPPGSNSIGGVTEADGANTALGSKADAANAATGSTAIAIFRQLHADLIAPTPAGTAIIGKVGIDQTTPGTTNGVVVNALPAFTQSSTTQIGGTIALGYYNSALQTYSSGFNQAAVIDKRGHWLGTESGSDDPLAGIAPVVTAAGTSAVGKASAGNLYSAYAVNSAATAAYLVCIDATAAPSAGAAITPKDVAYLGNTVGATAQINYGAGPPNAYTTGITCLVTTSLTTYTAGPNDFISVRVR